MKATIGVFGLSSCAGCQLQIVNLEEKLLPLVERVDVAQFQMASSTHLPDYDIAFVEGAVTCDEEVKRLRRIRKKAGVLVALGNCATHGGMTNLLNYLDRQEAYKKVYKGSRSLMGESTSVSAISKFIDVDYSVYGCPMNIEEFLALTKALIMGTSFENYNFCVCAECKANDNRCLFDIGVFCLGPISRAGCSAKCPSNNYSCLGCRGLVDEPNIAVQENILLEHNLTKAQIAETLKLYGLKEIVG